MPFSVQVSSADKAGAATAPLSNAGGAADPQASSLGDTFAALMQACLPAGQPSGSAVGGQVAKPSQSTGAPDELPRTRKGAADALDAATAQLLVAQLPMPVALPSISGEATEVRATDTQDEMESPSQANTGTAQLVSPDADARTAVSLPVSTDAGEQTNDDSRSTPNLVQAFTLTPTTAEPVTTPAIQHPADQANTSSSASVSSPSHVAQLSHAAHAAVSIPARMGDSASSARTPGQQPLRVDAQRPMASTVTTFAGAPSPSNHQALSNPATPQAQATATAMATVPPASGNEAQGSLTPATVQVGYTSQAVPAVASTTQTSGGNAEDGSQDSGGDAPSERKGNQGASRVGTSLTDGDTRVGMNGWVGTVRTSSDAAAQRSGPEAVPTASSGMTNLSLDRIDAQSSARRLTNALRSDMSFGVQTAAFGKVNIQAALHGDQLASQISLEHAHQNASTLAAHMPVLESTLGEKYKLDATVTVQNSGTATGGGTQDRPAQESRQQQTGSSPHRLTPTGDGMTSTANFLPGRQTSERFAPAAGRLDLVV